MFASALLMFARRRAGAEEGGGAFNLAGGKEDFFLFSGLRTHGMKYAGACLYFSLEQPEQHQQSLRSGIVM